MADVEPGVRVIVGLGNPGPRYARTRHNAGFWLLDEILRRFGGSFSTQRKFHGDVGRVRIGNVECHLLKPMTYMNHSGLAVGQFVRYYRLELRSILVAYDDIDLPPGVTRLKQGGGHGGHNGLRDTVNALGARDFNRLRVGVGHPGHRDDVIGYVLSAPSREEQEAIEAGIADACGILPLVVEGDWGRAFQRLHSVAHTPKVS
ncbi:MAG: aminoacyl-tRNA hydrolase [Nitrococcus mobilis]|nr:aminoacyl-tRNA hydrolase [Nitrococcus mobilis]